MKVLNLLGKLVPFNLKLDIQHKLGVPHMFWSMRNLKNNGFEPKSIIDAGAFDGEWTKTCVKIFPASDILMIEGQENKKQKLEKLSGSNISYEIAIIGKEDGTSVNFVIDDSNSNIQQNSNITAHNRQTTTIDTICGKRQIKKVDFLKLDIQGYELEALKGAEKTLQNVEVILIEVSLIDIGNSGVPLFNVIVDYLYEKNFALYDICSTRIRRPLDNALWQTDLIFITKNSALISSQAYN